MNKLYEIGIALMRQFHAYDPKITFQYLRLKLLRFPQCNMSELKIPNGTSREQKICRDKQTKVLEKLKETKKNYYILETKDGRTSQDEDFNDNRYKKDKYILFLMYPGDFTTE